MNIVPYLAIICIGIEIWHLVYYTLLYEKYFKYQFMVASWAENYEKFYENFINFCNDYVNNQELRERLNISKTLVEISNMAYDLGAIKLSKHNILRLCTSKQWCLFLLQQLIELVYWIITISFIPLIPNGGGLLIFISLWIFSKYQKKVIKDGSNYIYHIIDSFSCIIIFTFVALFFS